MKSLQFLVNTFVIIGFFAVTNSFFFKKDDTVLAEPKWYKFCKGYDNLNADNFSFVMRKYNRTVTTFSGNITFSEIFDERYSVESTTYIWSDGGWKFIYKLSRPNACLTFQFLAGRLWIDFLKAANITDTNCPIKPGFYTVTNFPIFDVSNAPFAYMPGRYYVKVVVRRLDQIVLCIEGEIVLKAFITL